MADDLRAAAEALAAIEASSVDLRSARERVAEATRDEERLRERVAAARGELRARRELDDGDATEAREELEAAAAALARAETERVSAEQTLARRRERAADVRDARERRLRLRDRLENRRREARRELARGIHPAFRDALAAVPGGDPNAAGDRPGSYDGDSVAATLAAVRVAELDAPVVLSESVAERFGRRPEAVLGERVCRPLPSPSSSPPSSPPSPPPTLR